MDDVTLRLTDSGNFFEMRGKGSSSSSGRSVPQHRRPLPLLPPLSFHSLLLFTVLFLVVPILPISTDKSKSAVDGRYKVYQIRPDSEEQLVELNKMEQQGTIDFWRPPPSVNATGDVMVDALRNGRHFLEFLREFQVEAKVLVDDLSKLIEEKETGPSAHTKLAKNGPILRDNFDRFDAFGLRMGDYHSFAELLAFMQNVQNAMPNRAQLRTIGWTAEGRPLQGIQFGNPSDKSRPVVWIDAGIHAREWTAVHTAAYFIFYIANQIRLGQDQRLLKCLERLDVLVLPCINPDGYEFTRSEPRNPAVRMWRKNRSKERCATSARDGQTHCCKGVDLNRNFDFKFAGGGTSFFPCSEIFHGDNAFSELETRAVRDAIIGTDLKGRVPAMITMHAYSQLWIYPFSNRRGAYPADVEELKAVARRAVTAIADKFGTNYQYGTGPETIYAYTGGSADWAKETAKVKYTYTLELRPSYYSVSAWNGFVLDRAQLIPTARETYDGVLVVLEQVAREMVEQTVPNPNTAAPFVRRSIAPAPLSARPSNSFSTDEDESLRVSVPSRALPRRIGSRCEDALPYCAAWVSANERICVDSKATMERECRKSCKFC
uniref:ShKT domain-containing protein n=1 Tax=Globodera rostochiensis TaxID=31243 RepID=A0A914I7C9_GLORO